MSALGAFSKGMGQGVMMSEDAKDRRAARELADKSVAALAQAAAAPVAPSTVGQPVAYTPAAPITTTALPPAPGRPLGAIRPGGNTESATADVRPARGAEPLLFDLIDQKEGAGNFSTLFGHSQKSRFKDVDVSRMTIGQLKEFSRPDGEYGQWVKQELARNGQHARVATPMGRHQIVGTTLRNAANAMGLPDDTVFDAKTQNAMAMHLARQRLASASTIEGKRRALRAEWEGFRSVSDAQLDRAIRNLEG